MRGHIVFFTVKYHLNSQESKTENVIQLGHKCNEYVELRFFLKRGVHLVAIFLMCVKLNDDSYVVTVHDRWPQYFVHFIYSASL